jgi:hypothetical protein
VPVQIDDTASEGFSLYVDVLCAGIQTKPLEDYYVPIVRAIEKDAKALDLRAAPGDSALAFGKWKGVLAGVLRMKPPAPGNYTIHGVAESEIKQVVVEALQQSAKVFVRGLR